MEAPLRDEEHELVALFEMADLVQGNLLQGGPQPAADVAPVPGPIGVPVPEIADPAVVNPVPGNNGLQPNPPVLVGGPANAAAANVPAIPAIVNPAIVNPAIVNAAIVNPQGAIGANPAPDVNQLLATMQNQQVMYTQVLQAMTDRLQQMGGDRALPPVRAIMPKDVHYSGSRTECYETWLGKINQTAVAEQWNDNDRRRAAIGTLRGTALKWHEQFGAEPTNLIWGGWEAALRNAFVVPLTESEWAIMVENRIQGTNETAADYVMEKNDMFRRRPGPPMAEIDRIPFLIRGLSSMELRCSLMAAMPVTLGNFLTAIRTKEAIMRNSIGPAVMAALQPVAAVGIRNEAHEKNTVYTHSNGQDSTELLVQIQKSIATLAEAVKQRNYQPPRPPYVPNQTPPIRPPISDPPSTANTPVSGANAVPMGTRSSGPDLGAGRMDGPSRPRNDYCFNCDGYGHWARHCPHPRRERSRSSGNGTAGSAGQVQQNP